ncbi:hypothetical protein [Clostridium perfringens]|uniref:hypothetical protein n=1 Tax=Clostridium perfringens TaxID=1502 RepID=UPI0015BCE580|nr:hypothetical protein [Clostridium perfringens]
MGKIKNIETDEVHVLNGNKTACGFDITEHPENWETVASNTKITCEKKGCKSK